MLSWIICTSDYDSISKCKTLSNGFAQGVVSCPDFFNLYKWHVSCKIRKIRWRSYRRRSWTMEEYYWKSQLCLNAERTEASSFHLTNQMDIVSTIMTELCPIKENRILIWKALAKSYKSRNDLLRNTSGTDWGENTHTLQTTALWLSYSKVQILRTNQSLVILRLKVLRCLVLCGKNVFVEVSATSDCDSKSKIVL